MAFKSLRNLNSLGKAKRYRSASTAGLVVGGISSLVITLASFGNTTANGEYTWNESNENHEYSGDYSGMPFTSLFFWSSTNSRWENWALDYDFGNTGAVESMYYSTAGSETEIPTTGWTFDDTSLPPFGYETIGTVTVT
jgi:hypothetical protein